MQRIDGLEAVIERYDGFLIDQFGVIMDGSGAYPGAAAALAQLARAGKRIVLLSNSGRRAGPNIQRLLNLGFARDSFVTVQSSGETAFAMMSQQMAGQSGGKVFLISHDNDTSAIAGLPFSRTDDPAAADCIFIAGSEADKHDLDDYRALLAPAARKGTLACCTNPDRIMLTTNGPAFGAAIIAEAYAEMGGKVSYFGKPYPEIYQHALLLLDGLDRRRVLCIGDSPEHDLLGARRMGLDICLVQTGIHAGLTADQLLTRCDSPPDFLMPAFDFANRKEQP